MRGQQKWAFSKWDTRNDWLGHYKHCDNRLPEQEHACYQLVAVFYVYDRVEDVGSKSQCFYSFVTYLITLLLSHLEGVHKTPPFRLRS